MIFWNDGKPESESRDDAPNTYYLIKTRDYGAINAMYIDNEWWHNYVAKVSVEVVGWTELN